MDKITKAIADDLFNVANADEITYKAVVFAVGHLRYVIDRRAEAVAKAKAEHHDDPDADDYEAHHAPAEVQYPRAARDEAIRQLVAYYLKELKPQY